MSKITSFLYQQRVSPYIIRHGDTLVFSFGRIACYFLFYFIFFHLFCVNLTFALIAEQVVVTV